MSVSELNQFMTYVLEGWMLFSASFISIGFVSFVSRRIQEDLEAEAAAIAQGTQEDVDLQDAARLEEVAAVSEQLAQSKEKQASTPSVSVSATDAI